MMRGGGRAAALLWLAIAVLGAPAWAQAAADADHPKETESTARLRAEIEKKKQELTALQDQLAGEEQKQRETQWAAEDKQRQEKRARQDEAAAAGAANGSYVAPGPYSGRRDLFSGGAPGSVEKKFFTNVATDQKMLWLAPTKLKLDDARWAVPFGALTIGLVGSDLSLEQKLPSSPTTIRHAKSFSNYGAFALAGSSGMFYLWGKATGNDRSRETGLLSGEAMVDTFLNVELLKYSFGRQRPLEGNGRGEWRMGGSSFPSEHSAVAFAAASVIAQEYPGFMTKFLAYGGATAVAAARVIGRQHFSSDVFIGSAIGWYVGHEVYRAHHNPELGGADFGNFVRTQEPRRPETMGSVYVALDSWVYPAFDRLAALGYVQSGFSDVRPWTRMECARLLSEDEERMPAEGKGPAVGLFQALRKEFTPELTLLSGGRNVDFQIESVYTRFTGIAGPPMTDGFHFGSTIINDFGRPFAEGANLVAGVATRAEAGPFAFYVRGEIQHSPSSPPLSEAGRQTIATVDCQYGGTCPTLTAASLGSPFPAVNAFQLLDAYVAVKLSKWQFSFGRQSLWWGPTAGGPMMLSDNALPIPMLRINQVSPVKLPSIFKYLGPMRSEFFIGRLEGHDFIVNPFGFVGQAGTPLITQPYINGQRISFKPTPNFEFGVSKTSVFAGEGYPLTWHTFQASLFSFGDAPAGSYSKPGDRRTGFDFSYRLPKLRDKLTFYADGFTEDQINPIAYADRSAWAAGLYAPRLPWLPNLDLRVEGVYTDLPIGGRFLENGFFYFNGAYVNSYTNDGNLLGSWIGRQGQGAQAWATYHLSAKNYVQLNFRHQKVSPDYIPNGGTLSDFGVKMDYWLRPTLSLSGTAQYERWNFPVLAPGNQSNMMTSFQLTFWPGHIKF